MLKLLSFIRPTRPITHSSDILRQQANVSALLCLALNHKPMMRMQLLSSQTELPRLPVPHLNDTLNKYLRSVKPLLTQKEYDITERIVNSFGCPHQNGAELQKLLIERAKSTENWLADWWLQTAYLAYRMPLVVYSSPGLVFPLQNCSSEDDQIALATQVILAASIYKELIDSKKIAQEKMGKQPLDMSQYSKVFGTNRMPGITEDTLAFASVCHPPKHVVVARNNHFFEVTIYGDTNRLLSFKQVESQLKNVIKASCEPAEPVGILTTENRDIWGKAYQILSQDPENVKSLESVEKSLFLVCLDGPNTSSPKLNKLTKAALQMVHGCGSASNGANRWYDKTIQFIIGTAGELGLAYEHSPAEGPPIANLMDHIIKTIEKGGIQPPEIALTPEIKPLKFNVPCELHEVIGDAKKHLDCLVKNLEMSCFTFEGFGKEFPKSQKLSPDSFIQMAIQLAFYRLHKKPGAHYESASTRKFLHGRTETIRSCSLESVNFAKTMLDKHKSNEEKVGALKTAVAAHKEFCSQAVNGYGIDRHLLGLKLMACEIGQDVPKIFLDPGYIRSTHMRISSSQVAARCKAFMCYGPLVEDGYGCCYNPRDNEIVIGISAFRSCPKTSADKFKIALEKSLNDMEKVLLQAKEKAKL